ncbi:MAG: diphthine--ammonia ligase [Candidatus Omnitrophica bacterium]|nr:diphthine--ammonia ligase [Candidatus Omnitrophota bacterium]MCM8799983.1 diphthine--ammonia ligase [Candidatus Omnitrophota bacterium]
MADRVAACSWSSGKDSCLALYRVMQNGYRIAYIFNFISHEYGRVSFHGTKSDLVQLQSEALGIPLIQKETTKDTYEDVFRKTLQELKRMNINQIIRGDIYLQDLQKWVENICNSEGFKVISPLWGESTPRLLNNFVNLGFKAIVTSIQADKLDESWLGRTIDKNFIKDLQTIKDVDICGEKGEYHTFVYDGPIFNKRINIKKTKKLLINNFWFLDIQEYSFEKKERRWV